MTDAKTYEGGCHCGRVRFRVETTLTQAIECNCSICGKRGALWAPLKAQQFTLLSGEDALTDYQFARKKVHHLFCENCGVGAFSRGAAPNGEEMVMANVRCLDGVDIAELKLRPFDGKNL
ncbi:GFA family protein [Rhodoplanes sp. Z2-YC6860]|uniref:GFA family protein n=1 Tax=Rhodoplanes sp. Z2-YC6860 TaxID=674703 RepID=UPI00078D9BF1|nr:GFA family protein [Rhodoplanes sp. Z2-YC6860]AMN42842.1 glutathione-dependent formaldehyde-activating protein [Rhodoplanes sp. Z2-YC6860]